MKKIAVWIMMGCISCLTGCATVAHDQITQHSTIDALLAGVYDGSISCETLLEKGDFGIGTFDRLDGEMIVLDDALYQVRSDGKVYRPDDDITTPFAVVCNFFPEKEFAIQDPISYEALQAKLDEIVPNQNIFVAVKITGSFAHMKTRSVPAQEKPYPPLVEVAKTQPVFEMTNVAGTIIGFRAPPFVKGINVAGYHFHFLSKDCTQGGHILSFELIRGTVELDVCNKLLLDLPDGDNGLIGLDLTKDRTHELEKVEK